MANDEVLAAAANHLGDRLRATGRIIATAESCTGGWVAKVLTDRPGSSDYVTAGLVTYSNAAKQAVLGVSAQTLAEHGAVSEPVVQKGMEFHFVDSIGAVNALLQEFFKLLMVKKKPVAFGAFFYDKTPPRPYVDTLKLYQTIGAKAVALGKLRPDIF